MGFSISVFLNLCNSQSVLFSISVFLNLCDSQSVLFSISVFLNLCDSQLVFFSISAIWGRHPMLYFNIPRTKKCSIAMCYLECTYICLSHIKTNEKPISIYTCSPCFVKLFSFLHTYLFYVDRKALAFPIHARDSGE